jgi:hypothetical protein
MVALSRSVGTIDWKKHGDDGGGVLRGFTNIKTRINNNAKVSLSNI